ncbi:hypothetical protein BDV98DRAFT_562051 [Pterulicium gracile]|uniref:BTB domain-containing protein n=1 Tax=Pterulicium gracile TaxID=1884261 RepID=A0A5C3QQR3_9AGAR|nr:hypothetical protein BDV98DRAFT_562051 [Pterula gracilis]
MQWSRRVVGRKMALELFLPLTLMASESRPILSPLASSGKPTRTPPSGASQEARDDPATKNPSAPVKCTDYYLESIVFKVTLTCLPWRRCRKPSSHAHLHQVQDEAPKPDKLIKYPDTEGQSDDNPIFLEGVQYTNFERFLRVFYPLNNRRMVIRPEARQDLAISKLDILVVDLEPLDQVALGRTHRNTLWFMAGLTQLVRATSSELPHRTAFFLLLYGYLGGLHRRWAQVSPMSSWKHSRHLPLCELRQSQP